MEEIKKAAPQNRLGSTELLAEQCKTAWQQVMQLNLPNYSGQIKNIVFCGMGASVYGALVIKALLGEKFPFPVETVSDYHIPEYVSNDSLIVLTSYSGTTEEVLSCAHE